MKKFRKCKTRRALKNRRTTVRRGLRAGSKDVKRQLMVTVGVCDICGTREKLQLHHIYLIRHGFKTRIDRTCLLCDKCHKNFHHRFDKLLDKTFHENPDADFRAIYEELKNH